MAEHIYHMCQSALFREATNEHKEYYPPTYAQDGFVHATSIPSMLIEVANHFYKDTQGETNICRHALAYLAHTR